jgi:hypothetical protein
LSEERWSLAVATLFPGVRELLEGRGGLAETSLVDFDFPSLRFSHLIVANWSGSN